MSRPRRAGRERRINTNPSKKAMRHQAHIETLPFEAPPRRKPRRERPVSPMILTWKDVFIGSIVIILGMLLLMLI
jgi:hypothetical protein